MYFDDFECDMGLGNSFDALVEEEMGQMGIGAEPDIQVSIPSSSLPDLKTIEAWKAAGSPADWDKFIREYESGGDITPGEGKVTSDRVPEPPGSTIIVPKERPGGELRALERAQLVEDITSNLTKKLIPRLKKIDKRLKLAAAQRKATDEHNRILERDKFRHQVILELKHLSQLLPVGHPVRNRIDSL